MPRPRRNLYSFIPKPVVKIVLIVFVLLTVLVGAAAGYTWYMGRNVPAVESAYDETAKAVNKPPLPEPTKPAMNANVNVAVQSLTSPVAPGDNSSIIVRTLPDASCVITVKYNETLSKDSGLIKKTADEYGMVNWSWTVDATAPEGKWPVDVTCSRGEKSGMVRGDLEVKL